MEFQDMTVMAGNGSVGDCFRACVATIIGRKTEGVPHFALLGDAHAMETAVAWLNSRGYEIGATADTWADEGMAPMPLHIMKGMSPRGIYHAVVGDTATGEMVHDPHPSRAGINGVNGRLYLFRSPKNANVTQERTLASASKVAMKALTGIRPEYVRAAHATQGGCDVDFEICNNCGRNLDDGHEAGCVVGKIDEAIAALDNAWLG